MRIPTGKIDQNVYFIAVDATDLKTRKTGQTTWTVYRSRNGAAPVAYTTPTVVEVSASNMPGVYALLVDEDTTIAGTSDSEEYVLHITHAGMAPVSRTIELYRPPLTAAQVRAESDAALAAVGVTSTVTGRIDATITSRNAIAPDNATITAIHGLVDTEVGAIKTVTDRLDTAIELDGAVYRFTTNALEQAPVGGGGGATDWTATEREHIRHRLGINGTATAPTATPSLSTLTAAQVNAEADTALLDVGLTPTVTGRIDAAISSRLATSGYTAAPTAVAVANEVQTRTITAVTAVGAIATGGITAASLAADAGAKIADTLLDRDMAAGADTGSPTVRTVRQALRFLRNRWGIAGTTLTVYREDDATASWTSTVATTPGADPVTGTDPA